MNGLLSGRGQTRVSSRARASNESNARPRSLASFLSKLWGRRRERGSCVGAKNDAPHCVEVLSMSKVALDATLLLEAMLAGNRFLISKARI